MSEATENTTVTEENKEQEERTIVCYVSKRKVLFADTVEVEFSPGTSYRVHQKYINFDL